MLDLDNGLAAFAHADPLDWHVQVLFDEMNIRLCVGRQLVEGSNVLGALQPSRQSHILNFNLTEVGDGAREVVNFFAVQFVATI